jgi:hypothetical protein
MPCGFDSRLGHPYEIFKKFAITSCATFPMCGKVVSMKERATTQGGNAMNADRVWEQTRAGLLPVATARKALLRLMDQAIEREDHEACQRISGYLTDLLLATAVATMGITARKGVAP